MFTDGVTLRCWLCVVAILLVLLGVSCEEATAEECLWTDDLVATLVEVYVPLHTGPGSGEVKRAVAASLLEAVEAHGQHPYAADALLFAATCLESVGQYTRALDVLERVARDYGNRRVLFYESSSWYATLHELYGWERTFRANVPRDPGLVKRHLVLRRDAECLLNLYAKYLDAYPERAADWAHYLLARIRFRRLGDPEGAKELLQKLAVDDVQEERVLKHQDQAFAKRLDAQMPPLLKESYVMMHGLYPRHLLRAEVRRLRVRVGLEEEEKLTPEQEAEAKAEAERRLEKFWREHKPEFESCALMEEEAEPEQKEQ